MASIIIFFIAMLIVGGIVIYNILTTKSNKCRRMFRDEDMKHIVIDGVGGLHFDPEYFLELPRFKKVAEEGSKVLEGYDNN